MKWGITDFLGRIRWLRGGVFSALFLVLVVTASCAGPARVPGPYAKPDPATMTPSQQKINPQLLRLDHRVRGEGDSITAAAASLGFVTTGDGVLLDIVIDRKAVDIARKLDRPGVVLKHVSTTNGRVSVSINDVALLEALADLPEVQMIMPEYGARTHNGVRGGAVGKGHMK